MIRDMKETDIASKQASKQASKHSSVSILEYKKYSLDFWLQVFLSLPRVRKIFIEGACI